MFSSVHNLSKPAQSRVAVGLMFFFCGLVFASWAARIPTFKEQFRLNEAELGRLLFMLPLGSFVALPFAGWSVERFGSRVVVISHVILYVLSLCMLAISSDLIMLSIALFFFGFIGDVVNIAMNTQGLDVQRISGRPILSSFHALWSMGALSGALIGGMTIQWHWNTIGHFILVSIPVVILGVLSRPFLVPHDADKGADQKTFVFPDKALLLIGMICFCCTLCEGAMADWSALYYQQVLSDPGMVSTTGFTGYAFMMTLGRFTGDRLILRFGQRKILLMDGVLITGGMLIALSSLQPMLVLIGFGLVGFGVSTIVPIAYAEAGKSVRMKPGVALATVSTIGFTGFLIGPPIIGYLAHEVGLRTALLIVAVLGCAVLMLTSRTVR